MLLHAAGRSFRCYFYSPCSGRCLLHHTHFRYLQSLLNRTKVIIKGGRIGMGSEEKVKHIEECSVANALGTWVFSVAGALIAIPVGIKRKSLAPLVFYGTTGTMLDIILGITACEREHAERQMQLLESQASQTNENSLAVSDNEP